MSLRSLLKWHKFVVQTNQYIGQSETGSLQRKDGWITVPKSVEQEWWHGQLQNTVEGRQGRNNTVTEYGIRELELYWTIFHNHKELATLSPAKRILININPKLSIDFTKPQDIRIFEVISAREPVALRERSLTLFEVYLKQIFRQSL